MPVTFRELHTIPLTKYSSSSSQSSSTAGTYVNTGGFGPPVSVTANGVVSRSATQHSFNGIGTGDTLNSYYVFASSSGSNTRTAAFAGNQLAGAFVSSELSISSQRVSTYMDSVPLQTIRIINGFTTYTRRSNSSFTGTSNTSVDPFSTTYSSTGETTFSSSSESNTTFTDGTNFSNRGTYAAVSVYDTTVTAPVNQTTVTASNFSAKTTQSSTYTTATDASTTGTTTYLTDTTIPYTSTVLNTTKTESKVYKTTSSSTGYSTPGYTTHTVSIPQYSENMYTQKSTLSFGDEKFFSEAYDETSSAVAIKASSTYAIPVTNTTSNVSWTSLTQTPQTVASTTTQIVPGGNTTFTSQYTSGNQVSTTDYTTEFDSISTGTVSVTTGYMLEPSTATSENTGITYTTKYTTSIFDKTIPYLTTYRHSNQLNSTIALVALVDKLTSYTTTEYLASRMVNSSSSFSSTQFGTLVDGDVSYTQFTTVNSGFTKISAAHSSYPVVGAYSNQAQAYGGDYEQLIALPSTNMTIYGLGLVGATNFNVSFSSVNGAGVMAPFPVTDQTYSTNENSVSFTYTTSIGTVDTTSSSSFAFSTIQGAKTSYKDIVSVLNGELSTVGHGFTTDATLYINGFYKVNGIKTFTKLTVPIGASTGQWLDALAGYSVTGYSYANPLFITYTS